MLKLKLLWSLVPEKLFHTYILWGSVESLLLKDYILMTCVKAKLLLMQMGNGEI